MNFQNVVPDDRPSEREDTNVTEEEGGQLQLEERHYSTLTNPPLIYWCGDLRLQSSVLCPLWCAAQKCPDESEMFVFQFLASHLHSVAVILLLRTTTCMVLPPDWLV